jgi:dipeptidyl aminopeptidase/acylaminoacyl peptidase
MSMFPRSRFAAPAALAAALLIGLAGAAQAQGRPFTAKDLVTMDRASDPQTSPDGRYVLYDVRSVDYPANKASHALWLIDLKEPGANGRKLAISEGGASNGRWSADGKSIYFLSSRSGGDQVWRTDVASTSAVQATRLPLDVGAFRLAADGKHIVVSMAVFPDAEDPAATKQRQDARKAQKASGVVYDKIFVRHWDTWADGTRNHLFALGLDAQGLATGAPTPLMAGFDGDAPGKPFGGDEDFSLSPDGQTVYFSARLAGTSEPWSTNFDLYAAPIDGSSAPKDLTADNPADDGGPVVSPDGHWLAYRAQKRPGFESDRFGIWLMDMKTGARHEVDPAWDHSAEGLTWTPDGRTLLTTA